MFLKLKALSILPVMVSCMWTPFSGSFDILNINDIIINIQTDYNIGFKTKHISQ